MFDAIVHMCPKCNKPIYIQNPDGPDECAEKYKEHQLWYHPSNSDVTNAVWDLGILAKQIELAFFAGDTINASMTATDLANLALRVKKYADDR